MKGFLPAIISFEKKLNTQNTAKSDVILIGQEADSLGGSFDVFQAYSGQMTDFKMWDRVLEPLEIALLSKDCNISKQNDLEGNVADWNKNHESWTISDVEIVDENDTCRDINDALVASPASMKFSEASKFCLSLGGGIPYQLDSKGHFLFQDKIKESFIASNSKCQNSITFWLGLRKNGKFDFKKLKRRVVILLLLRVEIIA